MGESNPQNTFRRWRLVHPGGDVVELGLTGQRSRQEKGHVVQRNRRRRDDVLEVETRYLRETRAYDVTGLPFADDGKTVVKERLYLDKADPNVLWDDLTVFDSSLTQELCGLRARSRIFALLSRTPGMQSVSRRCDQPGYHQGQ